MKLESAYHQHPWRIAKEKFPTGSLYFFMFSGKLDTFHRIDITDPRCCYHTLLCFGFFCGRCRHRCAINFVLELRALKKFKQSWSQCRYCLQPAKVTVHFLVVCCGEDCLTCITSNKKTMIVADRNLYFCCCRTDFVLSGELARWQRGRKELCSLTQELIYNSCGCVM